jgi:hypothetical protein
MRLVSHFPRTDAGIPKLEINPRLPMELARYRLVCTVDDYMRENDAGITGYDHMYQLDKLLCLAYWMKYDGLTKQTLVNWHDFEQWFLKKATPPEYITRARRWLRENHLAEFPKHVVDAANRSEKAIANQFSGGEWDS